MKKKLVLSTLALLLACSSLAVAQQPQTSDVSGTQPSVGVNANWVNGVAPGYWPTAGSGLVLNLSAGTSFCASAIVTYTGGTLTLSDNSTNYVYLDSAASCTPASNTTGFSSTTIPIATVITASGVITSIQDDRTLFVPSGAGAGTGITSLNGLSGTSQSFATGTSGTDFNISSTGTIHTFNFPDASASARGLLTSADWSIFDGKAGIHGSITAGDCASWYDSTTLQDNGAACGSSSGSSLFTSFQVGTDTPITGSGKYFQLAMGSNMSYTLTGSGTSSSPFIATLTSTGGGGGLSSCAASSGSGSAYTCTASPAISSLSAGQTIAFEADVANTGSATLNVSSLGAATIEKECGTSTLTGGELSAGAWVILVYDGTYWEMQNQACQASLPSFTWDNQGSSTVTDSEGTERMVVNSSTTAGYTGRYTTAPSTPYTLTAQLIPDYSLDSSNYKDYGLYFRDSTTGEAVGFRVGYTNGVSNGYIEIGYWNSPTSESSTPASSTSVQWIPIGGSNGTTPPYGCLRIRDDGTNLSFWYSLDCVNFTQYGSSLSRTAFLTSGPDQIGYFGFANVATGDLVGVTLMKWVVTQP